MRQRRAGSGLRIAGWVLVPLGLVLVLASIAYARTGYSMVTVTATSMEPTYHRGERLAIERIEVDEVRRGDAVLIHVPGRYRDQPVMKRVIGIGGDRVACCDAGRVTVDGKPLDEPYLLDGGASQGSSPYDDYDVRVPEGRLFLLGDNRANSRDSRSFLDEQSGTFAASGVRGRVTDSMAVPGLLTALAIVGATLTLVGTGLGIGGFVAGRRGRRPGAAGPPWPVA